MAARHSLRALRRPPPEGRLRHEAGRRAQRGRHRAAPHGPPRGRGGRPGRARAPGRARGQGGRRPDALGRRRERQRGGARPRRRVEAAGGVGGGRRASHLHGCLHDTQGREHHGDAGRRASPVDDHRGALSLSSCYPDPRLPCVLNRDKTTPPPFYPRGEVFIPRNTADEDM